MTIKELCSFTPRCRDCEFYYACPYELIDGQLYDIDDDTNMNITNSIIETAKLLQEDNK